MSQVSRFCGALAAFLLVVTCLRAQDATGKITGVITDPSSASIAGASVTETNIATNLAQKTTTNASGSYQVSQLPIGLYRVAVVAPGFQQAVIESKTALQINETLRIDAK